jgi:uroporphyrin-III C-methyltransferase/precorrin-2 dehydrogenase/sirohydrochlorin ferrochelatase
MPRKTLSAFCDRALAAGLDPATPALAIQSATRMNEAHVAGTISNLPDLLTTLTNDGPILVMIGRVLRGLAATSMTAAPLTRSA